MNEHSVCPADTVNAPVETVWALLTQPAAWEDFFDLRITRIHPAGSAAAGQKVHAKSGFCFFTFRLIFEFTEVNAEGRKMGLDVLLPFGIKVREDLVCSPLGPAQCRVNYRCAFSFPSGWRGAFARAIVRNEFDKGPADSLDRLKNAAERRYGKARGR